MSLWKWNDVELEIDVDDADFMERFEKSFEALEKKENALKKSGLQSSILKDYCQMFYDLFDNIFGCGTAEKLFNGKKNARICEDCYESFIDECNKCVNEANKRRTSMMNKYKPNRAQRRAQNKSGK